MTHLLIKHQRFLYPPISTATLPNPDPGPDIRNAMKVVSGSANVAPDGTLYLPTRTYYGGDCGDVRGSAFAHAFNAAKPRNGWLHIKSFQPGGAVVDLSNDAGGFPITDLANGGALNIGSINDQTGVETLRIIFEDITFVGGTFRMCGTDRVRFFNCRHTIPRGAFDGSTVNSWQEQFNAVCAATSVPIVSLVPDTAQYRTVRDHPYGKNNLSTPTGLRLEQSGSLNKCINIWTINTDIHDVTDDGIFSQGLHLPGGGGALDQYCRIQGMRIWNVFNSNDRTLGPGDGSSYGGTGPPNWYHNNPIQTNGGEFQVRIADSILGGQIQYSSQFGSIDYVTWDRIWQLQSPSSGMVLTGAPTYSALGPHGHIGGTTDDYGNPTFYIWMANGQGPKVYDPGSDNGVIVYPTPTTPYLFQHGLDGSGSLPTGCTLTGGEIDDIMQWINKSDSPPALYRASHSDMDTVFAGTFD